NSFNVQAYVFESSGAPSLSVGTKNLSATGTQSSTFSTTDTGDQMYAAIATFKVNTGGGGGGSAPATPTDLAAVPYEGKVYLTWTASTGSPTDYIIEYKTNAAGSYSTFSDGTSTSTSVMVTGLNNGTLY